MESTISLRLPDELQAATKEMVATAINSAIKEVQKENSFPPYLNKGEAATYVSVSRGVFNEWVNKYHIPIITIEGIKRFRREDLDNFMKEHTN